MFDDTINEYIRQKLLLFKDFRIKLNKEELEHIYSLKTEVAVDNFAHRIFNEKL